MSAQAITKSAEKKRAFSESVERDRRAFEMMAEDKRLDFFTAMQRVFEEESKR